MSRRAPRPCRAENRGLFRLHRRTCPRPDPGRNEGRWSISGAAAAHGSSLGQEQRRLSVVCRRLHDVRWRLRRPAAGLPRSWSAQLTARAHRARMGRVSPANAPPEGPIDPRGSKGAERSVGRTGRSRAPGFAGTLGRPYMRRCHRRSIVRRPPVASRHPRPMRCK